MQGERQIMREELKLTSHLVETLVSKQDVYRGRMIHLRIDTVRLPDGKETTREIVEHPGAVAVVAETEDGKLVLVTQYRHPIGQISIEIPAGKLEPGELIDEAAHRELLEETGYRAKNLFKVMEFYSTPGFSDEIMHLFVASGLTFEKTQPDEDEFIDCKDYNKDEVMNLIQTGQIKDAKTLIGLFWWLYGSTAN